MIYYYTYKIVCLKGSFKGKYYFGQHSTKNLEDGYNGCGKKLRDYYKKYGAIEGETYRKEIIQFYNSPEELNKGEQELIGDKYKTDENCLNLRAGGMQAGMSDETKEKISIGNKGKHHIWTDEAKEKLSKKLKGRKRSEEHCKHLSEALKGKGIGREPGNKGKHQSEKTKRLISEKLKGKEFNDEYRKKLSEGAKRMWENRDRTCWNKGLKGTSKYKHWRLNPITNKREYYI